MNRIYIVSVLAWLTLQSCGGIKQIEKKQPLSVSPSKLELVTDQSTDPYTVAVNYTLTVPKGYVPSCGRLVYSPRFTAPGQEYILPPVIINGKTYNRIEEREQFFGNEQADYPDAVRVVASNETIQVQVNQRVPFQLWMPSSKLIAITKLDACDRESVLSEQVLADGVFYIPQGPGPVIVKYVQKEVIKKEEGFARFYYPVNRYNVDPSLYDNRKQLDQMDALISKVLNDTSMHVNKIVITGICSPEGSYAYNEKLAKERANSIKSYLMDKFNLNDELVEVKYIAEDWDGLKELVMASTIPDKSDVLRVIDTVNGDAQRDAALARLSQYPYIKSNIFPQLRKVTYEVVYTVKEREEIVVPE